MARTKPQTRLRSSAHRPPRDSREEHRRELKRRLRLAKDIAKLSRQLERQMRASDRELRTFAVRVFERDGDFNVTHYVQIRDLLVGTGELRDGEDVYAAVQRLIGTAHAAAEAIDTALSSDPAYAAGRA